MDTRYIRFKIYIYNYCHFLKNFSNTLCVISYLCNILKSIEVVPLEIYGRAAQSCVYSIRHLVNKPRIFMEKATVCSFLSRGCVRKNNTFPLTKFGTFDKNAEGNPSRQKLSLYHFLNKSVIEEI